MGIEQAKEKIALLEVLERLDKNPAFKELISKEYLETRTRELLQAAPSLQPDKIWLNSQIAVSNLQQFLYGIRKEGVQAKKDLEGFQAALNELHN